MHRALMLPWLGLASALAKSVKNVIFPEPIAPSVRRLEQRVRATAQWKRVESDAHRYEGVNLGDPQGACKFLSLNYWLRVNVERVLQLGLDNCPPQKILDLGSGCGLFAFICRVCGHDAVGLDRPLSESRPDEALVYPFMTEVLGVTVIRERIDAFVALNGQETYDLITAYMVCFNQHTTPQEWERPAWEFFLTDIARHLRPGGRLHLRFNPHEARYGKLRFWSDDMLDLFRQLGTIDAEGAVTATRDLIEARNSGALSRASATTG